MRFTRRAAVRYLSVGALGAAISHMAPGRLGSFDADTEDFCSWVKVSGPACIGGQLIEQWCYRCCAGIDCEYLTCENRVVGSC